MTFAITARKYFIASLLIVCAVIIGFAAIIYTYIEPEPLILLLATGVAISAAIAINCRIYWLIGQRLAAEERLRKSEELFSIVMNGINDGLFDYHVPSGKIYYSPSYKRMLGFTDEELGDTHTGFDTLVHPDDREPSRKVFEDYIARRTPIYNNEFRLLHKNGQYIWVLSRGVGIWDADGKINRLIGTHADISIQKQREEELHQLMRENERQRHELLIARDRAEAANKAKSEFLATMSHEIRTPLNGVIGLARLMMNTPLNDKQKSMMETLSTSGDVLLHLVNDVLDLNRIEAAQVELELRDFTFSSIFATLHGLFDSQMTAKSIRFSITDDCGARAFVGDPLRLRQILVNLVGNALKFTQNGTITLKAEALPRADGLYEVRLEVRDTGIGIAPEKLPVIFDKFVQADQTISRRYGGSGLGLAICQSLAEMMGGHISVESQSGEGSVFTVRLPMKQAASEAINTRKEPTHFPTAENIRGTILVVEDYPANIMVVTLMLRQYGYQSDVASSGAEALIKIAARTTPYDAILMDVQMPGMDGFETTQRVRALEKEKNFRHTIIGVTAHSLAGDRDRCINAGMDDYISKPIQPEVLAEKLSRVPRAA